MTSPTDDRVIAAAERRGRTIAVAALTVLVVLAVSLWGAWSWILDGEPERVDTDVLEELVERFHVVDGPTQKCPMGSDPVESCWAEALVTTDQDVRTTQKALRVLARSIGWTSVDPAGPDVVDTFRRDDLCLNVYNEVDPFGNGLVREPVATGTVLVYLSAC